MQVLRSYRFREETFEGDLPFLRQASKDIAGPGHRCGVVVGRVASVRGHQIEARAALRANSWAAVTSHLRA